MPLKILIISYTELHREPRVLRQMQWLGTDCELSTAGLSPSRIPGVRYFPIVKRGNTGLDKVKFGLSLLFRRFESYYWDALGFGYMFEAAKTESFDVIIAHDYDTLPVAVRLAENSPSGKKPKIVFEAHEYSPGQFESSPAWRLLKKPFIMWILKKFIGKADDCITVCSGIAEEYGKTFHKSFEVVTNASPFYDLNPKPTDPAKIKLIHHGAINRTRRIDVLIKAMSLLDERFSLDLVLVETAGKALLGKLKEMAAKNPRIRILPPVPYKEIIPFVSNYDVGLCSFPATTFNLRNALPNKFFEYIQARMAIVISSTKGMSELANAWGFGIVAASHSAPELAKAINSLDGRKIDEMKLASHRAASELCAEKNGLKYREIIRRGIV